jgi:acyl-coenzyme A thioesterase PaaI-like protein/SAM-dependent methyltransferase
VLAGLPAGARVVIRSSDAAVADILAECHDRRLVAVPVGPRTGDDELVRLAERVSASLILDGSVTGPRGTAPAAAPDAPTAADLAFIIFTSGSTGQPKGVMLDRSAVAGNATKTARLHGFSPDRPHATCLPLHHVNALIMSFLGTRLTGTPLSLCEPFRPDGYFDRIAAAGARTASIVPALIHDLLEVRPAWPESLDYLITAGAPLTSELAGRFYAAYGPRLRQGYGLSEAVNFSFVMPSLDAAEFRDQYVVRRPPVGLPLPETEVRLHDDEVWLRTPDLMRGYWADPVATAAALTDGWLRTGDLGELRDGFLVLTGRRDERINRGGTKYYPLDLERQWAGAGLTGRFAAVPVASEQLGQDVGLVLDSGSPRRASVLYEGATLSPVAVRSDGMLATDVGKVRRTAMGRLLVGRHESAARYRDLLRYARRAAAAICASPHRPRTALASHLRTQALALLDGGTGPPAADDPAADDPAADDPVGGGDPSDAAVPRSAGHDALDALVDYWPALADGSGDGESMMRAHPGLWRRLMTEWPMGSYVALMNDVLDTGGLLHGRVLEIGSGVGNTTERIADRVRGEFVWSDRSAALVRRGTWAGRGEVFDFDQPPPPHLTGFDTILATNAVHCAADKARTLRRLRSMLVDGGTLVLAEGANPTTAGGQPWALNVLFAAFAGWWDRGGFLTRWQWLELLEEAGFDRLGYAMLRTGEHDLGGVVWGERPGGREPRAVPAAVRQPHHPDFADCFGCAPDRDTALGVRVVGAPAVEGRFVFTVTGAHQGAPGTAHGGVLAAALDEALGIAAWSLGRPHATGRLEVDYLLPVPVGATLSIRTSRTGAEGRKLHLAAEARLGGPDGPVAVRASALYVELSADLTAPGGFQVVHRAGSPLAHGSGPAPS